MSYKNIFKEGAIPPDFISNSIAEHSKKKNIGGHSIFLGQVRNDVIEHQTVVAIDYTAYQEMANKIIHEIREATFEKFNLTCMHIYHSLGSVAVGEICLFVFTSSKHRKECMEATDYVVERLKKESPIWGKEIFENEAYQWKTND
jgi:molybdopterin synthase catalytic subunit